MGGKDQFRRKLRIFIKDHNFSNVTSIIIVRDADNSAKSALQSVQDDPLAAKAIQFINDAVITLNQATSIRKPPPPHKQGKAKVHAFLATFEYPDKDLGKAALGGVWNFQHQALAPILNMLQEM